MALSAISKNIERKNNNLMVSLQKIKSDIFPRYGLEFFFID
jgi:hypothetical protein